MVYTIKVNTKTCTIDDGSKEKKEKVIGFQQKATNVITSTFIYLNALRSCFFVLVQMWLTPLLLIERHFEQTGRHLPGGEIAMIFGAPTWFECSFMCFF